MKKLLLMVTAICMIALMCFTACGPEEQNPQPQEAVLTSIKITVPPTKTTYEEGENFNKTGMVVTAVYSDNTEKAVTDYTFAPSDALCTSDTEIVISYTEKGVTKTVSVGITVVNAAPTTLVAPVVTLRDDAIYWNKVEGATAYEVYVNSTLADTVTETTYNLSLATGAYEITVKAISGTGDSKVTSDASAKVDYIYSSKLTAAFAVLDGNVVRWQGVEKADCYDVYVNEVYRATVSTTSYTIDENAVGVYSITIIAKDSTGKKEDSDVSNAVAYTVSPDLTKALVMTFGGRVINGESGYLELGADYTTSSDQTSVMLEQVDSHYAIRTFSGLYLVYVPASDIMENRSWVFEDCFEEGNTAFLWDISPVAGTADAYTLKAVGADKDNALAVIDGDLIVDFLSSPSSTAEQRRIVLKQSNTAVADFQDRQIATATAFDMSKPFVAYYNTLNGSNLYLGMSDNCPTTSILPNFLSEKTSYSKYAALSMKGKNIFQFEKATDFASLTLTGIYEGDGSDLYRIRTYDGLYLGAAKNNYIGTGADYISASCYDSENLWQIWQVTMYNGSDNQVMIKNLGHNYDWNSANDYMCNLNRSDGSTGFYLLNDSTDYFVLTLTNADVTMLPQQLLSDTLDGKTITISNFASKQGVSLGGDANVLQCNDTDAAIQFTLEHVDIPGEPNAYRIKTPSGKYLAYSEWYCMYETTLIEDYNDNYGKGQIWVILPVIGVKDGYTIGSWWCGREDHGDGNAIYRMLFLDNGIHPGLEDGTIYSEFGKNEHRNYCQRIWLFDTVES